MYKDETPPTETTVVVVAPSNLHEGYTFDVTHNGRTFSVTVPEGGVVAGQTFNAIVPPPEPSAPPLDGEDAYIPAEITPVIAEAIAIPADDGGVPVSTTTKTVVNNPDGSQSITEATVYHDGGVTKSSTTRPASLVASTLTASTSNTIDHHQQQQQQQRVFADVPTGKWRHGFWGWCCMCCSPMFWMSLCCTYITLGQLLQRLKLSLFAGKSKFYKDTCSFWVILLCMLLFFTILMASTTLSTTPKFPFYIVVLLLTVLSTASLTRARYDFRQRYQIPARCCSNDSCFSDCCLVYWCMPCTIVQMLRHTHDGKKYRYKCCSQTGLGEEAPEIEGLV